MLKTVLRAAMGFHHFTERRPGYVGHTATTKLWAGEQLVQAWLGIATEEWVDGVMSVGVKRHPEADNPATSAFMLASGNEEASMYAYFDTVSLTAFMLIDPVCLTGSPFQKVPRESSSFCRRHECVPEW
jgi:hypothetical protein